MSLHGKPWSEFDDAALIAAHKAGKSPKEIGELFPSRRPGACARRLRTMREQAKIETVRKAMRMPKPVPKPAPHIEIPAGATLDEVRALFGRDAVENMLKSRGYREQDGRYYPRDNVMQVEDHFYQIRVSAPPQGCFACGCRVCACWMAQAA